MPSGEIKEFVIFDVETTGLSPRMGDRIIEIAALRARQTLGVEFREIDRFHSLIDPRREVSPGAYMVNRISREMLQSAPLAETILPSFLEFMQGACIVGHNIGFDLGFLAHELSLMGRVLNEDTPMVDTMRLARGVLEGLGSYSLGSLSYELAIERTEAHRAMADVEVTFALFRKLLEIADRREMGSLSTILRRYGRNIAEDGQYI